MGSAVHRRGRCAGELPVWTLPESGNATPASLRLRRAAPCSFWRCRGPSGLTRRRACTSRKRGSPPFDVDEVLRRSSTWHSFFGGGRDAHPGQDVYWQDYYELRGRRTFSCFRLPKGLGARSSRISLLLSRVVTDGMICVASDNPYGERDLTSDKRLSSCGHDDLARAAK